MCGALTDCELYYLKSLINYHDYLANATPGNTYLLLTNFSQRVHNPVECFILIYFQL